MLPSCFICLCRRRRRSRIECLCGASGAPEDEDEYAGGHGGAVGSVLDGSHAPLPAVCRRLLCMQNLCFQPLPTRMPLSPSPHQHSHRPCPSSHPTAAGLWLQCDACDAWMHAACVGLKRAPPGEFVCGPCQRAAAAAAVTQDCGATLVVCPTPIVHQW